MANMNFDESTRREWRELGFFYDRDDAVRKWRIVGTAEGLQKFASMVSAYASDATNDAPSEHQHFGPYMFLEIGTWHEPEITHHWIAGPVPDLAALAAHVRESIPSLTVGVPRSVRAAFSPTSEYGLVLELGSEPFDPAGEDSRCA